MILFDSGVPLANVALTDTFSTQRTRVNQIMNQAAGHAANNVFTGTLNTFNNNVSIKGPVTAPVVTANSASFKTLQADHFDLDGDVTVDALTANSANIKALQADHIDLDGDMTADVIAANTVSATTLTGTLSTAAQPNITSVGTLTGLTTTGNINLGDSDIINFGADNDLQIQHNGSHSYISDAGTGNLYIQTSAGLIIQNAGGTETMGSFTENGAVSLYHDNAAKVATTATGISVTGDVVSSSDISLKENVRSIENALDIVKQLDGVRFNWKEDGRESIGFTAQQIEPILPEVINTDENGSKSVNYSVIVSVLVEAIKELSDKIENQG